MKKNNILLLLVLIIQFSTFGQNCNNGNTRWQWKTHSNWFMGSGVFANFSNGNGTLSFNVNNITNNFSSIVGYEGTSTISDELGNLLYYTGGRNLFNKQNILKYSGLLSGNENGQTPGNPGGISSSSVNGVLIVKHPKSQNIAYIFTTDDALTTQTYGLNYWTLNISTGTVAGPTRLGTYRTTEQLDATFHANGKDIWVSTRESGLLNRAGFTKIYSYLVTSTGVSSPVVSSVAPQVNSSETFSSDWERGSLKFSWDGTKASTVNDIVGWGNFSDAIVLYNFDNSTGLFSGAKSVAGIWGGYSWIGNTYSAAYDCEFTPDSKGLYVSFTGNTSLIWLDVTKSTSSLIYQSIKTISNSASNSCDIKFGGDGKLYQSTTSNQLNVFNGTDLNTGTGINLSKINLPSGQTSGRGFSNMFIASYVPDVSVASGTICNGGAGFNLTLNGAPSGSTFNWTPAIGLSSTTISNPIATPSTTQTYTANVTTSYGCLISSQATVTVNPKPIITITSSKGTSICSGQNTTLTATSGLSTYSWSPSISLNNSTQNVVIATPLTNTTFTLTGTNSSGCSATANFAVTINPLPTVTISASSDQICKGDNANLTATQGLSQYLWSPSASLNQSNIYNPVASPQTTTEYTLVASNSFGCQKTVKKTITIKGLTSNLVFDLPSTICEDKKLSNYLLTATPTGGVFSENGTNLSGSLLAFAPYNSTRTIKYTVLSEGCTSSVSKSTVVSPQVDISWGSLPTQICQSTNTITLNATPSGGVFSGDNVSNNQFIPSQLGNNNLVYTYTTGSQCVYNSTKNVLVKDVFSINVSIQGNKGSVICDNQPVKVSAIGNISGLKYSWVLNGQNLNLNDSSIIYSDFKENDIVQCKVQNLNSSQEQCYLSTDAVSNSLTFSKGPSLLPIVQLKSDVALPVSSNQIVNFTATGQNFGGNVFYKWFQNGKYIDGVNTNSLQVSLKKGDMILCKISPLESQCFESGEVLSNTIINGLYNKYYEVSKSEANNQYIKLDVNKLFFKYCEKYNAGTLDFKIYNSNKVEIVNGLTFGLNKTLGDNYFVLDLNSILNSPDGSIYKLVINGKEQSYLNFIY